MIRHRATYGYSIAMAVILLTAFVVYPLSIVPPAYTQNADQEDGSTSGPAEELKADLANAEAYDQDSVEADPKAPDDREDPSTSAVFWPIPVPLPGGLDHVANGVGTRNAGFGTIRLRGAPVGSVPVRAFLYWGTLQAAPAATQVACFNGRRVIGRLIGVAGPTCWGAGVFAAYRASVIALITPGINNDYRVSCLPSSVTDGRDPWDTCAARPPLPLSQGATLVVLYANRCNPRNAQVFINEGAAFLGIGGLNVNNPFPPGVFLRPYSRLKHTRVGGDGQVGFSTNSINPVTDERTFIGPPFFTQIKGRFSPFNWDSDFNGDDGGPLNQLWDTHTDSFGNILAVGIANYVVRYTAAGDCVFPVVHVLGAR